MTTHSRQQADVQNEPHWKFLVLSQGQARQRSFKANYILISIQNPDEPQVELPEPPNSRGLLRLQFDDILDRCDGLTFFGNEQALEILDFVHEHLADMFWSALGFWESHHMSIGLGFSAGLLWIGQRFPLEARMSVQTASLLLRSAQPDRFCVQWQSKPICL